MPKNDYFLIECANNYARFLSESNQFEQAVQMYKKVMDLNI